MTEHYLYALNARCTSWAEVNSFEELRAQCPWRGHPDSDAAYNALISADDEKDYIAAYIDLCKSEVCDYGSHPHTHSYSAADLKDAVRTARSFMWNILRGGFPGHQRLREAHAEAVLRGEL